MTSQRDLHRYLRNLLRGYGERIVSIWNAMESGQIRNQDELDSQLGLAREEVQAAIWELLHPIVELYLPTSEQQMLRDRLDSVLDRYREEVERTWDRYERGRIESQQDYSRTLMRDLDDADEQMWCIVHAVVEDWLL